MPTTSLTSGLPLQLDTVPADLRIAQRFTWLFSIIGALLLLFGLYLVSGEVSPSKIEWQIGGPSALVGILLLAYDLRRRTTRVTLVAMGNQAGVYRRGVLEQTAGIDQFTNRGSRFNFKSLIASHAAVRLAVLSIIIGAGAAFGVVVFLSFAVFGHFYSQDALSLRERVFALLSAFPLLAFIVNLVMAGFYRVEVAFSPVEQSAEGFELLFSRSAARVFKNRI
jgi:hypothetical protein